MGPAPDLLNNYLNQQLESSKHNLIKSDTPDEKDVNEFKKYVKTYLDTNADIDKLKGAIKDRNKLKKELNELILKFMTKFNIEDLNTKQGTIRLNVKKVKAPLSQKEIKERLTKFYSPNKTLDEITEDVFNKRDMVEKQSLKIIK